MAATPEARLDRYFPWVFTGLAMVYLAPLWTVRLLPFVDLPQHLALVAVLRDCLAGDPAMLAQYSLHWFPVPYLAFHLPCGLLSLVMPVEIAARLLTSAVVVMWPLSFHAFVRSVRGDRWFSLAAFPLCYGFCLMWGFMTFVAAVPLVLLALALFMPGGPARGRVPGWAVWALVSLLPVVAFLAHVQAFLILVMFLLALAVAEAIRARRPPWQPVVALIPSVALFFYWRRAEPVGLTDSLLLQFLKGLTPDGLLRKVATFPGYVLSDSLLDAAMLLGLLAVVLLVCVRRPAGGPPQAARAIYPVVLLGTAAAAYLLLPDRLSGQAFVGCRLAPFVAMFAFAVVSTLGPGRLRRAAVVLLVAVSAAWGGALIARVGAFDREARPACRLIRSVPQESSLVGLAYWSRPTALEFPSYMHFACYHRVWNRGDVGFLFMRETRVFVVRTREPKPGPRLNEWNPWVSLYPDGWRKFDYFLTCGSPAPGSPPLLDSLRLRDRQGIWALYTGRR